MNGCGGVEEWKSTLVRDKPSKEGRKEGPFGYHAAHRPKPNEDKNTTEKEERTTLLFPNTKCSKNLTPASGFAALISANIAISSFTWDWDGACPVRLPVDFVCEGAGGGGAWDVRSYQIHR